MTEKTKHTGAALGCSEYDRRSAAEDAEGIERIEKNLKRLDNAHFAFLENWIGWQDRNDISREDLAANLRAVEQAAMLMRSTIATLQERRVAG